MELKASSSGFLEVDNLASRKEVCGAILTALPGRLKQIPDRTASWPAVALLDRGSRTLRRDMLSTG
jgi:hypothetical protein